MHIHAQFVSGSARACFDSLECNSFFEIVFSGFSCPCVVSSRFSCMGASCPCVLSSRFSRMGASCPCVLSSRFSGMGARNALSFERGACFQKTKVSRVNETALANLLSRSSVARVSKKQMVRESTKTLSRSSVVHSFSENALLFERGAYFPSKTKKLSRSSVVHIFKRKRSPARAWCMFASKKC